MQAIWQRSLDYFPKKWRLKKLLKLKSTRQGCLTAGVGAAIRAGSGLSATADESPSFFRTTFVFTASRVNLAACPLLEGCLEYGSSDQYG